MKLIVSDVAPAVARVLGFCQTDQRVYDYINEASRRLLQKGMFAGTYGRFTIYPANGCITWPRQIETIESVATCCGGPGQVRNQWYEFNETGYGLISSNTCLGNQLIDRGTVVTYRDMSGGTNSYVRAYPGHASDVGKTLIVQGYDANGQWIRTLDGSTWIDGEKLTLALTYVQSTNKFTSITGVIREATNTVTRLYEYNATTLLELDLAVYEPTETLPQYRRTFLTGRCHDDSETNDPVTVMAKLRHVNVSTGNDYVIPPCEPAIKLMVQAIRKEECDLLQEAAVFEGKAVQTLQEQTMHYLGDAVGTIRMVGAGLSGGGGPQWM